MDFLFSKLGLLLIVAIILSGLSYWWYTSQKVDLSQAQLFTQIEDSYSRQFCNVVFPNIINCVTASREQCPALVHDAIVPCFESLKTSLPEKISSKEFKPTHARVTECLEMNLHRDITQKYLKNKQECWDLMS